MEFANRWVYNPENFFREFIHKIWGVQITLPKG